MSSRWLLWLIVGGYVVFVFCKGVLKVRRVNDADDFLVAGRDIGWFYLFCTIGATVIGGGASIGAVAKTYDWGVLMLFVSMGWYLQFVFSGLVVAPKFREAELYTVAGYFGHRFGEGPRFFAMVLSLLFSVFILAAQMAAFGSVLSAILPEGMGNGTLLKLAIIIGGSMVIIYSTAGGLLAVIHTDMYQFVILMVGFLVTLMFCVPDIVGSYHFATGTFVPIRFGQIDLKDPEALAKAIAHADDPLSSYLRQKASPDQMKVLQAPIAKPVDSTRLKATLVKMLNASLTDPELYAEERFAQVSLSNQSRASLAEKERDKRSLRRLNLSLLQDTYPNAITKNRKIPDRFFSVMGGKGWVFMITTFFAFLLGEMFAPGYATRFCVGKNIRETRLGVAGAGLFLTFTFPIVLFFIALYARIHFPDIQPQQALPMVVRELNNPLVGGLIMGALLMAVMSSADSALNSSTAIFVKDLFEHQMGWRDDGNGRMLKLARFCSMGIGAIAIAVAVIWPDIIGLLLFTYHLWAPAIIVPVCVGVLLTGRSRWLNRAVLVTMLVATGATFLYRGLLLFKDKLGWELLPPGVYGVIDKVDASVFGVLVAAIVMGTFLVLGRRQDRLEKREA